MEMENTNQKNSEFFSEDKFIKAYKNSSLLKFTQESSDNSKEKLQKKISSLPYFALFKYTSRQEKILLYIGITFGVLCGCFLPLIIIIYGEYTTLLVDRNTPNKTISPTPFLKWFNGGRETDNTLEDKKAAIEEDARAFGIEFGILAILQFIISFVTVTALNYSALLQTSRLRREFLKAILRQEMSWYDCNSVNSFSSKMIEDLDRVQEGSGEKIGIFINLVMSFIMSVTMAFFYGWKLTLVMLTCAPLLIVSNALVSKIQSGLTAQEMEAYGKAGSIAEEVFSSIKTVMAFNGQEKEIERYHKELEHSRKTGIRRGILSGLGSGVIWCITHSCHALAFWYGVSLILESREANNFEYTPAVLIIIFFGVLAGAINLGQSSPHLEAFSVARGSAASIFPILERTSKIDSLSKEGQIISNLKGEIEFKNVIFNYPARPEVQVLKEINLKIKSGETVAIVGTSGSGKSTILQLIQRFYDPCRGTITLDGRNLNELNVNWLRKQCGVVQQEPLLFATTIFENIKHGSESATAEDVKNGAKMANAHDFISKLPKGYQTVVGAKGSQISGGQKQRIAMARALLRKPQILLLDEATSALDAANEEKVQVTLDKVTKGSTTLIVTHKLSTIAKASRIIVMSEGRVMEEGTHEELLNLKGHYFKLLEMQENNEKNFLQIKESNYEETVELTEELSQKICRLSVPNRNTLIAEQSETDLPSEPEKKTSFTRIMKFNKPEWWAILIGGLSTFIVGGSTPALAILFGELYGVLSNTDAEVVSQNTAYYSGMILGLGVITGVATFLQLYLLNYAGIELTSRFRKLTFAAILKQEAGWFDEERHRTGILCARLSTNAADIQGATGSRIGIVVQSLSTIAIGVILGFSISWKMTLITLVAAPIIFYGLYFESKIIEGQSILKKSSIEEATKISLEAISNIRTVASLCLEESCLDRYDKKLKVGEQGLKLKSRIRGLIYGLGTSAPYFSYGLSLWYGGILVANDEIHYKNVIKVSEALLFGVWVLGQSLAFTPNFSQAKNSAARLFQLLDRTPKLTDGVIKKEDNWKAAGTVSFSDVNFSYPTRPELPVLKDLNLNIEKGQSIALVGPSGCGKSTVIQLLQRLYDPLEGKIYLNENAISNLKISILRRQFGIVSQEPVLFDRTIAENIAYGDNFREVPQYEIVEAARSANIHDFITSLPLGYETKVGPGGTQLSGGQKQRIAIARAMIRNPKILLLDEATSALDAESESIVQEALDNAASGRTTITVGHRMGAIKKADIIYHLNDGHVKKKGTQADKLVNMLSQTENIK